ncbi:MAG: HisA/HisF-related TIM barrel protein [Methanoregula sp.]
MKLILAMDLKNNLVVHGKSGQREGYKPLDWGCSPTADPVGFVKAIRPKSIYIADLDRIAGTGSHDLAVRQCAAQASRCYVDRGCRGPADLLEGYHIENIVGTETGGAGLAQYAGGFLSLDIKNGRVIPENRDPVDLLRQANGWKFDGCIILNITAVGTESGIDPARLEKMRSAYHRKLYYGGGVATIADLEMLRDAGFDGAIIATALHHGTVPIAWIRRGRMC